MRQVSHDELAWGLRYALQRLPASLTRDLITGTPAKRRSAEALIANQLAHALDRYEVLSSAPLPANVGDTLFSNAARRDLPGEVVGGGAAPVIEKG